MSFSFGCCLFEQTDRLDKVKIDGGVAEMGNEEDLASPEMESWDRRPDV